jgi:hypothetical protein
MSADPRKRTSVHCNRCGRATEHIVLHEEDRSVSEQVERDIVVTAYHWFRLIECAGCKDVAMEHIRGHSEDWDPEGGQNLTEEYFPPRTYRPTPKWLDELAIPNYVRQSLGEIYIAVQNDARSLASMGIRALLEAMMVKKVGERGTFRENLDAFVLAGHVSLGQRTMFETTLEVGHAAMHRGFVPSAEALVACLDATEHVVQSLYVFPSQSAALRRGVPKRKQRRKSPSKR